ncbi:hypothetical protein BGW41_004719 [Actinomortierella wolfii]|nr:hypothetical protein BGW41_004719 [Actinomortierella wolfii]
MRLIVSTTITTLVLALAAMPMFTAAKLWTVEWKGSVPSPQTVTITRGDTVVWKNVDTVDHAVVETRPGTLSCIKKDGGFSSSKLAPGQSWQRTFVQATTINYMDGMAGQCQRGGKGTIIVQHN